MAFVLPAVWLFEAIETAVVAAETAEALAASVETAATIGRVGLAAGEYVGASGAAFETAAGGAELTISAAEEIAAARLAASEAILAATEGSIPTVLSEAGATYTASIATPAAGVIDSGIASAIEYAGLTETAEGISLELGEGIVAKAETTGIVGLANEAVSIVNERLQDQKQREVTETVITGITDFITEPGIPEYLEHSPLNDIINKGPVIDASKLDTNKDAEELRKIMTGGEPNEEVLKKYFDDHDPSIGDLIEKMFSSEIPSEDIGRMVIFSNGKAISGRKLGYDLGKFMSYCQKKKDGNPETRMFDVSMEHPELAYLFKPVFEFERDTNFKPKINMNIFEIYDGKGIRPENAFQDPVTGFFGIIDETGTKKEDSFDRGNVPGFHGTYCGPSSKNDTLPVDILDTICMLHDIDYGELGYFSWEADQKMISRISHLAPYMGYKEYAVAKASSAYFQSIGYTVGLMMNGLPANANEVVYQTEHNDIFFKLTSSTDHIIRRDFYSGLREGLDSSLTESRNTGNISNCEEKYDLVEAFDRIRVK